MTKGSGGEKATLLLWCCILYCLFWLAFIVIGQRAGLIARLFVRNQTNLSHDVVPCSIEAVNGNFICADRSDKFLHSVLLLL
jgi:hypothetical protein